MALKPEFCFVSTMNQEYYNVVGKDMINSFLQNTPDDFYMRIYAEDVDGTLPNSPRLDFYDWNSYCKKNWQEFTTKTKSKKEHKFAKKGFAFLHALQTISERYFVWVDADIIFKKKIDTKLLQEIISKHLIALFDHSYLKKDGYSAESGFVVVDTEHKQFDSFCKTYQQHYNNRPSVIEHWWDGQVLMLSANQYKFNDLSKHRNDNFSHTPLNNCYLSEYVFHNKGKFAKKYIRNSK